MTDDLDRLKAALHRPPPAADISAREAALRLAMENFDDLFDPGQELDPGARSITAPPQRAGVLIGVLTMLKTLSHHRILTATTSVAALSVAVVLSLPLLQNHPGPLVLQSPPVAKTANAPAEGATALPGQDKAPTMGDTAASAPVAADPAPAADANAAPKPAEKAKEAGNGGQAMARTLTESAKAESAAADGMVAPAPAAPVVAAEQFAIATENAPAAGAVMGLVASPDMSAAMAQPNTETFANAPANPVHVTAEDPVSTFSVDVDTASYAVVRSSLNAGSLPPPEAVRIEEMVNYFPYAYAGPEGSQPFQPNIAVMPTPWNPGTELVRIGLQGAMPAMADRPALNLVFLIDTSGSMEDANKLPLLKQSLRLMLGKLRAEDRIAIVTYAGSAGEVLPPTAASDRAAIDAALDNLAAGGSTAGAEGIELAYRVAESMGGNDAVSRILLATDGDFNVGVSDPEALKTMVADKRKSGVYLSVLGFGRGNLDDTTMQALAQNGNGTASYIDTLSEAQKVLGDQLTGALFPIADDVKIQVEWNPAKVAEYRLIGYETRALRREDFNNDKVDAGEVGAGLQVTALYEITPPGSPALKNDALRYAAPVTDGAAQGLPDELGFLRLRWKAPGQDVSQLAETPITGAEGADSEARFAAAIAGAGQLLTGATYLGDWGWDQAIALAADNKGTDAYGYRAEAVGLMRLAQSLSAR